MFEKREFVDIDFRNVPDVQAITKKFVLNHKMSKVKVSWNCFWKTVIFLFENVFRFSNI